MTPLAADLQKFGITTDEAHRVTVPLREMSADIQARKFPALLCTVSFDPSESGVYLGYVNDILADFGYWLYGIYDVEYDAVYFPKGLALFVYQGHIEITG